ncbi:hypothetical protein JNUCC83_08830 [Vagococcus sp. JNUCC 83]
MKGRNEKSKKKRIAATTGLLAVLALFAGTFAWQSYTEWVKNHMQSRGYEEGKVTIVENFKPLPIDENPTITKDVKVINTSSSDSFVRISFEEMLNKLASGAVAKGYSNAADAKFPVIVNPKTYTDAQTGYTLVDNSKFVIKDSTGKTVATPSGLKFYISADDKTAGFFIENQLKKADFPKNFDFLVNDATVPVVSGSFANDDAVVAQKVTGKVEKQVDGTYVAYTDKYANDEDNFKIWGYGVSVDAPKEADWAGNNVNVTATQTPGTPGTSSVDTGIKFLQDEVSSTDWSKDWYYDTTNGYFYYTKVLKAGETTSSAVLKSITFPDAKTDQTYKVASYDLYVGLEAIPAAKSTLKAASNGGKFSGTPTVEGNKSWESNGFGWGLADNDEVYKHFESLATIVE